MMRRLGDTWIRADCIESIRVHEYHLEGKRAFRVCVDTTSNGTLFGCDTDYDSAVEQASTLARSLGWRDG